MEERLILRSIAVRCVLPGKPDILRDGGIPNEDTELQCMGMGRGFGRV